MHAFNWSSLSHAYGPASDVPALLERARSAKAPSDYRDEPWFSLWSALCHQGTVYSASYAALPELVAIAEARTVEPAVARECLFLAGCIEMERAVPEGEQPPTIPTEMRDQYVEALRRGQALSERLLPMANGDSDAERMLAIAAAAFCGDADDARLLAEGPDEE
jgi:hypothetical protein